MVKKATKNEGKKAKVQAKRGKGRGVAKSAAGAALEARINRLDVRIFALKAEMDDLGKRLKAEIAQAVAKAASATPDAMNDALLAMQPAEPPPPEVPPVAAG